MRYEEEYHKFFHKNLLTKKKYYLFRARCSNLFYWRYFKNKGGRIVEFGCGLGQNIYLHRDTAFGVDISKFCINEGTKRGIKIVKDIKEIKSESIDGIISVHTLEHLENPNSVIKDFYRIMKPKSQLILVLPYEKNKPCKSFSPTKARHLYNWTFKSINELLYSQGFEIRLNKFNYGKGYSLFYKLPFRLAILLLKTLGIITNSKEMIIVSEKK